MKFVLKKEIRWLVFLLVPFVCFLILHVLAPLLILTQSNPLLQSSYNIKKKQLDFRTIYSFQQINQRIITERLSQYYQIFQNIQSFIQHKTFSALFIDTSNIVLNNAYQFNQRISNNQTDFAHIELRSMWFAPNCTSLSDLSPIQKSTYLSYSSVEPYIRSLIPSIDSTSLIGIKTLLYSNNTTISFEYPSQYQDQYTLLNTTVFPIEYQELISNYITNNQSISAYLEFRPLQIVKLCLCTVLINGNGDPYGVSCLSFNLSKFAEEMYDIINFAHSDYFSIGYSILIPAADDSTLYLRAIKFNQTGGYILSNTTTTGSFVKNASQSSVNDTRIFTNGSMTTIYTSLMFEDSFNSLLYLSSRNLYITTSVSDADLFTSQINMTIGLIGALIFIASVISTIIMKKIMNSLDDQLIELSNYCTFVVEDDINIDIPCYEGTKDIRQVYEKVKIINKLNKYSHPQYFTGHYINKILSYCEAEKFFHKIDYDTGSLLENIGNCYFYMQEVDKTIEYYKESVRNSLTKIRAEFGTIDQIFEVKQKSRVSKKYREYEIILIRRLFNLIESYNCLLQCQLAKKIIDNQNEIIKDIFDYIDLLKKAVYPDFHLYAEFILVLFYQVKILLHLHNNEQARKVLVRAEHLCEAYIITYAEVGKKLKEKGSKYKLLHLKNKITSHSRMHPEKIKTFRCYFRALVLLSDNQISSQQQALKTLFQGTKVGIFSNRITWMIFKKIHRILQFFKINENKLFSLSIYCQICLLRDINEKPFHSESCLYRYPSQIPKQEREFIYAIDCLANKQNSSPFYFQNRGIHIFDKFIQDVDRVSIIKFNTIFGTKIECNLTFKESKEEILKNEILDSFEENSSSKLLRNELFETFQTIIYRIMKLKSEKIVLFFFQKLSKYQEHANYLKKKEKSRSRKTNIRLENDRANITVPQFDQFGDFIISVIRDSAIQKCKICFFCGQDDKIEDFRTFFGLNDINRRLWRKDNGVNINFNIVFAIQSQHKVDIERVLSKRVYSIPDNHIFIL